MLLMIDNYDSFTYNLVQYFGECGEDIKVYRNDKISVDEIRKLNPERIVISPGPGNPSQAGISLEVIKEFYKFKPILGVCLGHQSIFQAFGGKIIGAPRLMHGKTSQIYHDGSGIFKGIDNPFVANRYHSLIVDKEDVPRVLKINAWTKEEEAMGLIHRDYPVFGVQFHPESILTSVGMDLIRNFLKE